MKRMRVLFFSLFAVIIGLVLASCGSPSNNPTTNSGGASTSGHTHTYGSTWEKDETNHWHKCTECNETSEKAAHTFNTEVTKVASCSEDGLITYTCTQCGYVKTQKVEKSAHNLGVLTAAEPTQVEGKPCEYVIKTEAECEDCHQHVVVAENKIEKHDYVASITKAATCSEEGTLKYTCKNCNKFYVQAYNDPDAHSWDEGETVNGITTYTCTLCDATKTVISVKTEVQATVAATAIEEAKAVELKNATIDLGDILNDLAGATNVEIKADKVEASTLNLDDTTKTKVGDNEVFDFSLKADDEAVSSFSGYVTVTIPYTLKEGEDPNNVAIWYLSDNGTPEPINATYSNGYVTFETDHFSYYVVIQLTKEEACTLFGHNYRLTDTVKATCKSEGYDIYTCSRCGEIKTQKLDKLDHEWVQDSIVQATTETEGFILYKCSHCGETKSVKIPKLPTAENTNKIQQLYNGLMAIIADKGAKIEMTRGSGESAETQTIYMKMNNNEIYEIMSRGEKAEAISINISSGKMEQYSYSDSDVRQSISNSSDTSMMMQSMSLVMDSDMSIISVLSKFVDKSIMDNIWNIIFDKCCTKTEANGNVVYTVDTAKVKAFYTEFTAMTVDKVFDLIFGTGKYDQVLTFMNGAGSKKLSEVLTFVKTVGIDADGLINFLFDYMTYVEAAGANIPMLKQYGNMSQIKAMYAELKDKTLDEIVPMLAQMGGGSSTPSQQEDNTGPLTAGKNAFFDPETPATTGTGMDIASLLEMLTQFKQMTVNQVIAMFTNKFTLPTAEFIETYVKMVEIKLTTDKDNAFVALEFKMTNPETNKVTMAFTMAKSDVDVKTKFDEIKTKVTTVTSKFDATKDAKFLVDILKAKLDTTTDLKGEIATETYYERVYYTDSNGNSGYRLVPYTRKLLKVTGFTRADVKKLVELRTNDKYFDAKSVKQMLSATDVFLEIRFNSDSYISAGIHDELNYYTADILNSVTAYGTVKNNITRLDYFSSDYIGLGTIIFNRNDNKYYGTTISDISGEGYLFEVVAESDVPAGAKIIDNTSKNRKEASSEYFTNDTMIVKATSIYSGNTKYIKYDSLSHDGHQYYIYGTNEYYLSSYFNLGFINLDDDCDYNIGIETKIYNDQLITSLYCTKLEIDVNEMLTIEFIKANYNDEYIEYCGGVFLENKEMLYDFVYNNNNFEFMKYVNYMEEHRDEAYANYQIFKDFESKDGKISFKFKSKETTDCYDIYTFEVKINDKTYTLKHYNSNKHEYEEVETYSDGCEIITIRICKHCGYVDFDYDYDHDYQLDEENSYEATATQYGRVQYKCTKCEDTTSELIYPTYDGTESLYLEELDVTKLKNLPTGYDYDNNIVVGWYSPFNRYWDYDDMSERYIIKAFIVTLDENGEVAGRYEGVEPEALQCLGSIYDTQNRRVILNNTSEWLEVVAEMNAKSETEYRLAIVAVEANYGTLGYALIIE